MSIKLYLVCNSTEEFNVEVSLNSLDQLRFEKMSNAKKKQEFLFSRYVLKEILEKDLGYRWGQFSKEESGRPVLLESNCKMSMSHSGQYYAFLFSSSDKSNNLGIDVETRCPSNYLKLAERYFSNAQVNSLKSSKCPEKLFKSLWSLKEALHKSKAKPAISKSLGAEWLEQSSTTSADSINYSENGFSLSACSFDLSSINLYEKVFEGSTLIPKIIIKNRPSYYISTSNY